MQDSTTPLAKPARQLVRVETARANHDGFDLFILRSAEVELAVAPALGAKVVSLRNQRSGREWLWHPGPELKLFPNAPGDDFSASTLVGWDECLPTIAPCTWNGRALPDHGEAWAQPWTLDPASWNKGMLQTSVQLPVSGLHFTRTIALNGNRVRVDYLLENPTACGQEFIWAAHPLLRLHDGDRLELTEETKLHLDGQAWLGELQFKGNSPDCAKVYAGPLRQGRSGVFNTRTGDRLTFEWDAAQCDTLGLWLTRGGWHGHHHLALEPAIGADDSLAHAAAQSKRCGMLAPGGRKAWRLELHIES